MRGSLRATLVKFARENGVTLLILAGLIVYESITRLISPAKVDGTLMLAVALAGAVVNLIAVQILGRGATADRSLNVEGSYRHIVTDLYGFLATALAAGVILASTRIRAITHFPCDQRSFNIAA